MIVYCFQEGTVKIYVLLYEGIDGVIDVGSKYASDELQHENIVVCHFYYMCMIVPACLLTV